MTRPLRLIERQAKACRLGLDSVRLLRRAYRHIIDVQPTESAGVWLLRPRGWVGILPLPDATFEILPKISLRTLFDLEPTEETAGESSCDRTWRPVLHQLVDRFIAAVRTSAQVGWQAGYSESQERAAWLRGKLDVRTLLREPDDLRTTLPQQVAVLSMDTPWNRVPVQALARAERFLDLDPQRRRELAALHEVIPPIPEPIAVPPTDDLPTTWPIPVRDAYQHLLRLSRRILEAGSPAFLVSLETAYQDFLTRRLTAALVDPAWSVRAEPRLRLTGRAGELRLVPDVVVCCDGRPRAVVDAKWKEFHGLPSARDVEQVLAYALVLGCRRAILVYPGKHGRCAALSGAEPIRLSAWTIPVGGTKERCRQVIRRLTRTFQREGDTSVQGEAGQVLD